MSIELTSPAFAQGQPIPKRFTGDGEDVSPALRWSGVPPGTKQLAIVCDDPDAPSAEPWVHWVIYRLPPTLDHLDEGIPRRAELRDPPGAALGLNSWITGERIGYRGPAPPKGHGVHHYRFTIHAFDLDRTLPAELTKAELLGAFEGHVLATGELVGTYSR